VFTGFKSKLQCGTLSCCTDWFNSFQDSKSSLKVTDYFKQWYDATVFFVSIPIKAFALLCPIFIILVRKYASMRYNHGLVVVVIGVILAGCTGGVGTGSPDATKSDSMTPTPNEALNRTSTDATECDALESRSHPTPPSNLTKENIVRFTEQYANTSVWNSNFGGGHTRQANVQTDGFLVTQTQTGYIVHITLQFSSTSCDGVHSDSPLYGFDYFINESVIAVNSTRIDDRINSPGEHQPVTKTEILQNGTVHDR
jgi:hypothetical protein